MKFLRTTSWAGATVTAAGALSLVAALPPVPPGGRTGLGTLALAPGLAAGFVLCGIALLQLPRPGLFARSAVRLIAVLIALGVAAWIVTALRGPGAALHDLFKLAGEDPLGRALPLASFNVVAFFLTGTALALLGWRAHLRAADVFAASLAVATGVVGLGFIVRFAVGVHSSQVSMASAGLRTVLFGLIAAGLFFAATRPAEASASPPRRGHHDILPTERKLSLAFGTTLGLFAIICLLACKLFDRFADEARRGAPPAATAPAALHRSADAAPPSAPLAASQARMEAAMLLAGLAIAAVLLAIHFVFERDLAARRRADAALRRHNETLHSFAHTVAHDLCAPLRGIAGYARELEQQPADDTGERSRFCVRQIGAAARNLELLIADTLDYAQLDAETPQLTNLHLPRLIDSLVQQRALQIREYRAEVSTHFGLATVTGWERGVVQIIGNLLDNALKYSRRAQPPRIRIETADTPLVWRIAIHDNGVGFDMKHHDRIFGLFQRLVTTAEFEGTGAGLAIVRKITDRLGGTVRAEARPNGGATFLVELPKFAQDELT